MDANAWLLRTTLQVLLVEIAHSQCTDDLLLMELFKCSPGLLHLVLEGMGKRDKPTLSAQRPSALVFMAGGIAIIEHK